MENLSFTLFLIFSIATVLATFALHLRQTIIVAYILGGVLAGPSALGLIDDPHALEKAGTVGVTFLLFLLGLNLPPSKLKSLLGPASLVTGVSTLAFMFIAGAFSLFTGFSLIESVVIGVALSFSSTIIALKLLPTTVLHHKRTGEIIISILLLQDALAILVLAAIQVGGHVLHADIPPSENLQELASVLLALPLAVAIAYVLHHFIISLMSRFDRIKEYLFLIAIGWCVGIAELTYSLGLSHEIGAFIAGVLLATHPVSLFIGESLKPLRDFFLIIFFFAIGGAINLYEASSVLPYGIALGLVLLAAKPLVFDRLTRQFQPGRHHHRSREIGVRLGQCSEFALLVGALALHAKVIGPAAAYLIQITVITTFIASPFYIVRRYPTPIALSDDLRRD